MSPALLGALAALGSGLSWALGSILFHRLAVGVSPLGLNLAKGLLGLVYLGVALAFVGVTTMSLSSAAFLAASGVVGIALGDTLFFIALIRLKPRRTVLLATVGQALTVVLAMVVLGERPSIVVWVGIVAIVSGVTWVMREQTGDNDEQVNQFVGVLAGIGAALAMSVGLILAKMGLAECSALQATAVRLAAGMGALLLIALTRGQLRAWLRPFAQRSRLLELAWADVVIVGGGFYLSMLALALTDVTITSVLTSTEPLFVLPLAAWILKERITKRAMAGAVLATFGVALILSGG